MLCKVAPPWASPQGLLRSVLFWRKALPLLIRYRIEARLLDSETDPEAIERRWNRLHEKCAPQLLDLILHLKGFYVKVGQVASSRSDIVPAPIRERLAVLQDRVPPMPVEQVRRIIERELGCPPDAVFAELDPTPLGSASIGQCHRARLRPAAAAAAAAGAAAAGREVCVKVQAPGAERAFRCGPARAPRGGGPGFPARGRRVAAAGAFAADASGATLARRPGRGGRRGPGGRRIAHAFVRCVIIESLHNPSSR